MVKNMALDWEQVVPDSKSKQISCLSWSQTAPKGGIAFLFAKCVFSKTKHLQKLKACHRVSHHEVILYHCEILCSIFNNFIEITYAILLGQFFQTFSVCRWPFRSSLGSCSGVLSFFHYDFYFILFYLFSQILNMNYYDTKR